MTGPRRCRKEVDSESTPTPPLPTSTTAAVHQLPSECHPGEPEPIGVIGIACPYDWPLLGFISTVILHRHGEHRDCDPLGRASAGCDRFSTKVSSRHMPTMSRGG